MAWPFLFHCNTFLIRNHKSFKGACKPTCFDHFKTPNSYFGRWFFFIKLSIILTSQFHCIVFNHFIHFQFAQLLLVSCLKSAICVEICCKSYSTQAISPLVNFTWNSNDSFMLKFTWNKFHVKFMWKFPVNFTWNSVHVKFTRGDFACVHCEDAKLVSPQFCKMKQCLPQI